MSRLTVAAAQIEASPGDISANFSRHAEAIERARKADVDVLLFPELSLTDYVSSPDLPALARTRDSRELRQLAEAAGTMTVAVGFVEEGAGARFYNAQAILGHGKVLHVHRKINLPSYGRLEEGRHFAPGAGIATFALRAPWLGALLICADAWNPALPLLSALLGASLLLIPAASSRHAVGEDFDNPDEWKAVLRHTAMIYGLPLVMANHCGVRGGHDFWGGSCIVDAEGGEVARAGSDPGLAAAEIDYSDVRRARARLPTIRDATPHLVKVEVERWLREMASATV